MRKLYMLMVSLASLLTILLSGCGVNTPNTQSATSQPATQAPAATQAAGVSQSSEPTLAPLTSAYPYPAPGGQPATGAVDVPAEVQQGARKALAQKLGMTAEGLTIQEGISQEWPNEAMGCPDPAKSYADIKVPGYKLMISDGQRSYAVHTTLMAVPGEPIILCENGVPQNISSAAQAPVPDQDGQKMVDLASKDLATFLGIDVSAVKLTNIVPVEWPDSSLGCPKPDESYSQVITPGYMMTLKAGEQAYEYHTDKAQSVKRCLP